MKDKKLIIGGIALIILGVIVIVLYLNAHNNNSDLKFTTTKDVKTMINKVYKDAKVELPDLETNVIDIADSYQLSSFTGLESNDNIDFVVVSEPLINAQAYSLIVVKLKDKSNVEDIKKKMYDNIRMDKWICVSAEKLYITNYDNIIFAIMSSDDWATPVYNSFKNYVDNNIGKELTKSEEFNLEFPIVQ